MRPLAKAFCLVTLLLLCLSVPVAQAFDNTNSSDLQQSQTVDPQLLGSTVAQMAQQTSDPQLQALAAQFEQAMSSGNYNSERSALANLQSYPQLSADSPALSALVRSMTASGDGISVNPSTLASLLGAFSPDAQGVPSNMVAENPAQLASDLSSIMNLMNGVDPSLDSQLLNDLGQMSVSFPSTSSLGSILSLGRSGPAGLPSGPLAVGAAGPPSAALGELGIPVAIVVAVAVLFLLRNRLRRLMGGQTSPGTEETLELDEYEGDPGTPRARVIRAFNGMLKAMSLRGVVRARAETHREFSSRCRGRQEEAAVGSLSGYYEKARFSAAEVSDSDAGAAEGALTRLVGVGRERK